MKKILVLFLILFCVTTTYARIGGDGMGDHKAKRTFNLNLQELINGGVGGFNVFYVTTTFQCSGTGDFAQYIRHLGDPNTYVQFTPDDAKFVAGGLTGLHIVEAATDIVYIGDSAFAYIIFGDTTNFMVGISTYMYADGSWHFPFKIKAGSITVGSNGVVKTTINAGRIDTTGDVHADAFYDSSGQLTTMAGYTTFYTQLGGFMSDVYKSSAVPVDIISVGASSWTVTGIQGFSAYASTCASVRFNIKWSTGTDTVDPPNWVSIGIVEESTATEKSGWLATSTNVNSDGFIGLFIDFVSEIGGNLNVGYGATVKYYRKR